MRLMSLAIKAVEAPKLGQEVPEKVTGEIKVSLEDLP